MPGSSLLLSAAVNVVAGVVFISAGARFGRLHAISAQAGGARAFMTYWIGLGVYTVVGGVQDAAASLGFAPFGLFLAVRFVTIPILCVALGGLSYYFLVLVAGRTRWAWLPALGYALLGLVMVGFILSRDPVGVAVTDWRTDIRYAQPYETTAFKLIVLLLALPPLVGATVYLLLLRVAKDPAQRLRLALVGGSILLSTVAALAARLGEANGFIQLLSRPVAGLVVALAVWIAYARPPRLRAQEAPPPGRVAREAALARRVRELV